MAGFEPLTGPPQLSRARSLLRRPILHTASAYIDDLSSRRRAARLQVRLALLGISEPIFPCYATSRQDPAGSPMSFPSAVEYFQSYNSPLILIIAIPITAVSSSLLLLHSLIPLTITAPPLHSPPDDLQPVLIPNRQIPRTKTMGHIIHTLPPNMSIGKATHDYPAPSHQVRQNYPYNTK